MGFISRKARKKCSIVENGANFSRHFASRSPCAGSGLNEVGGRTKYTGFQCF